MGNPLLAVREPDRLLLSPHNAWSPVEAVEVLIECIARNIREKLEKQLTMETTETTR